MLPQDANGGSMKRKIITIVCICVTVILIILSSLLLSPTIRSYITGVPVHFKLIEANSNRCDVEEMYGEKLGNTPNGLELYKAKFLGVEGYIYVDYFEESDRVSIVQFVLRSDDYESYEDFENDVDKTYKYFSNVLRDMPKTDPIFEDGRGGWKDIDHYVAYTVYNVNTFYDETGTHYIPDETITVFQFNTWTDDMSEDFT